MKEKITAREYDPSLRADRSENSFRNPYEGLFYRNVEWKGAKRRVLCYTPLSARIQTRKLFFWLPGGVTAEEFLNGSPWADISEGDGCRLILLEADESGKYGDPETEIGFLYESERIIFQDTAKDWAPATGDGNYVAGFGDGAELAARAAITNPAKFSGVGVFGPSGLTAKELDEIFDAPLHAFGNNEFVDGYTNGCCPLPAFICGAKGENDDVAAYLREVNATGSPFQTPYGTVYFQTPSPREDNRNHKPVSRVISCERIDAADAWKDEALMRALWEDLFDPIYRFVEDPCGALRPYISLSEPLFLLYNERMAHSDFSEPMLRPFAVYLPSCYDDSKEWPLVVATHGFSAGWEYFAHNSEWWRVAEDRGFIVVFTQALPTEGTAGTPRWRSSFLSARSMPGRKKDSEEAFLSEIAYFRKVVETVERDFRIDKTRVYCTGHSNGSVMTYGVSRYMKDVFAASAQAGASVWQYADLSDAPKEALKMPALNIENGFDRETDPDDRNSGFANELRFRLLENGMDPESAEYSEGFDGKFRDRVYRNDRGLPLVHAVVYPNACHAYFPEISYYIWDHFFCDFSRDAKGKTFYRGIEV